MTTRLFSVGNWCEVAQNGAISKYYYLGGKRVALKDGVGNLTLLHTDHLGSTAKTSGTVPSTQTYYPFGGARTTSGAPPNHPNPCRTTSTTRGQALLRGSMSS